MISGTNIETKVELAKDPHLADIDPLDFRAQTEKINPIMGKTIKNISNL